MIKDSAHTDKDSIPPPALSGRGGETTRSADHTTGFVHISLNYLIVVHKLSEQILFYSLTNMLNTKHHIQNP